MRYRDVCWIFLSSLVLYLLFNWNLPITDPVESNYALTAKEMLASGDFLSTRIYGVYWYDKPALIYWTIIASYTMFGVNEFAARFPMAVAGALSVSFIYWLVYKIERNATIALLSAGILATSLEFWILAKIVVTDSFLFLFHSIAVGLVYLAWRERRKSYAMIAYGAAGLAVLTKGPVGIVLPALTVLGYILMTKRWSLLKRSYIWQGGLTFLVVAMPWYAYMYLHHGIDFINGFIGLHNIVRATISEHPEVNVYYYYLLVLPLALLPWTGAFIKGVWNAWRSKLVAAEDKFYCIWMVITVLFYTCMATKYLTYVFPAIFPAAIWAAKAIQGFLQEEKKKPWLWITIPMILLNLGIGFGAAKTLSDGGTLIYAWCIIFTIIIFALQILSSGRKLLLGVFIGQVIGILLLTGIVLSDYAQMRTARHLVAFIPDTAIVATIGDYQTSAVFYLGSEIKKIVDDEVSAKSDVWAQKDIVPKQNMADFLKSTEKLDQVYLIVHEYSSKKFQQMDIAKEYYPVAASEKGVLYKKRVINKK